MATVTASDIEPLLVRFGPEDTSAVPLVFGPMTLDSPEWCLLTVADATSSVGSSDEGA